MTVSPKWSDSPELSVSPKWSDSPELSVSPKWSDSPELTLLPCRIACFVTDSPRIKMADSPILIST